MPKKSRALRKVREAVSSVLDHTFFVVRSHKRRILSPPAKPWPIPTASTALFIATAVGVFLCARLIQPFLSSLAWALALAILFFPVHHRIEKAFKSRNLAAGFSVGFAIILVVLPALVVAQQLAVEAAGRADEFTSKLNSEAWRQSLASAPRLAAAVEFVVKRVDVPAAMQGMTTWLTGFTALVVRTSAVEMLRAVLTFYLLFYLLRDYRRGLELLKTLSPTRPEKMEELLSEVAHTIRATIHGTAVVSVVQGALGGLMLWWLGVPAPLFWGVVMALVAFVPILGAFIVWVPIALFLALEGHWDKALILSIWGTFVIGFIDNWLYPILVGRDLREHTVLAFLSTIGGIIFFGASGLILGPVTLTITKFLLKTWRAQETEAAKAEPFLHRYETPGANGD